MLRFSCLCGQLRVELQKRPDFIHECNCTLCSKTGARWGYFSPVDVSVEGHSLGYCRSDRDEPNAEVHFCSTCGSTTHFILTKSAVSKFGNGVMGVNMWLADPHDLNGIELRYPDGRSWSGEGNFSFEREARIL